MEKINFINNVTKANADTFNTMQDNIEDAIDGIIETGTTNGWTWVKYSNGVSECWKSIQWSQAITNSWGAGLYYGTIPAETFPSNLFISTPTMSFTNIRGTSVMCMNGSNASETSTGDIQISRGTASSGAGGLLSIIAKGNWK